MPLKELPQQFLIQLYRWLIIGGGAVILLIAVAQQIKLGLEVRLILLIALTALVASQITLKVSRFTSNIDVSDTFMFLALLIWGAPAAILTAAVESIAATSRVSRKPTTYLFNVGAYVLATWVSDTTLEWFFRTPPENFAELPTSNFISAMCIMSLTQYATLLSILAIMQALKLPSWHSWQTWMRQYYLWSCATFFVSATAAGFVIKVFGEISLLSIIIVTLIIALIYYTYRIYLQNLDALQESESRFRSSFDYTSAGMALVSLEGYWLQVNQSLCDLLGRSESELLGLRYHNTVHPTDLAKLEEKIGILSAGEAPACQMEVQLLHSENEEIWAQLSASTARDAQNTVKHFIFQMYDITLRKKAEEQLRYDACHDALTGLPNRAAYKAKLDSALEHAKGKRGRILAVLFLDLDGFKLVNDSLGHNVGDDLLKATAARLLECVRREDVVARLGGDEFTILLEDLHDVHQATCLAQRIKEEISKPFHLDGQEVVIGTSIGIASTLIQYSESGDILRDADAAMYQAKARGKNCYVLFDYEMHASMIKQLQLANSLRRAVDRGELTLHFQVMHSLASNEIYGFEALVRWNHPVYGVLLPNEFIPLAEENGLINQIDNWVLAEACRQMREWQKLNFLYDDLIVSVNVSANQFNQLGLVEHVKNVLEETGLNPSNLQLEITESAMLKNIKNTKRILTYLANLGIGIALDDFGTGYSSLSYLHELPIYTLKIDGSFVNRITEEDNGVEIVRAIVVLARNLRMKVVAEGIENYAQLEELCEMNCDYGQGYLFSRPVTANKTIELFDKPLSAHSAHTTNLRRKRLRLA